MFIFDIRLYSKETVLKNAKFELIKALDFL